MLIVIDRAVDVPAVLEHSSLLRRVLGGVWLGGEASDGGLDEFWTMMRNGTFPRTTPPTVDVLTEAYDQSEPVCAVHVSAELSATVARAREAATRTATDVTVIDSGSLSVGAGLVAAAIHHAGAAHRAVPPELAAGQPSWDAAILDFARSLPERLHTFALVQDVESLRRSDRSGLLPARHLAHNHPVVLAIRGRAVTLDQPRHRAAAVTRMLAHVRNSVGGDIGPWALGHGDAADADGVVEQCTRSLGSPPAFVSCLDPMVGAHVGPEAVIIGALSGPVSL